MACRVTAIGGGTVTASGDGDAADSGAAVDAVIAAGSVDASDQGNIGCGGRSAGYRRTRVASIGPAESLARPARGDQADQRSAPQPLSLIILTTTATACADGGLQTPTHESLAMPSVASFLASQGFCASDPRPHQTKVRLDYDSVGLWCTPQPPGTDYG